MEQSRGFAERWRRLVAFAEARGVVRDVLERVISELGPAGPRFGLACFEREGWAGFQGALRVLRGLVHEWRSLTGFVMADGPAALRLEVIDRTRCPAVILLAREALQLRGPALAVALEAALAAPVARAEVPSATRAA